MRYLIALVLSMHLLSPALAWAEERTKDPFAYPLRVYGLMLAMALLGGLVSWIAKVRRGEAQAWNVMQLVGELCTSAFAGLLAFWLCEWSEVPPILTAPLVGIAGHMGTKAIAAFEAFAQRRWGSSLGKDTPP